MNVVKNEVIVCFDVDDTLVLWGKGPGSAYYDSYEKYKNGLTYSPNPLIEFINPYDSSLNYLKPHIRHIELLKQYKGRGFYVRVWSAGGWEWAESVVKTLGLEDYVDSVETKPSKYVDDLQAAEVLGVRVYIKDEEG